MSSIYLNTLDDFLLTRIVKKFNSIQSGCRFYRSCRGARDFVESVKPAWPLPDAGLKYENIKRHAYGVDSSWGHGAWFKLPELQLCRVEQLEVANCFTTFFKAIVLPEIEAMGGVMVLEITRNESDRLSDEKLQLLLDAAKPDTVKIVDHGYDVTTAAFKDVKKLHFHVCDKTLKALSYWETNKVFGLICNRKIVTWSFVRFHKKAVAKFLETWLGGESTGCLEKLTYKVRDRKLRARDVRVVLNRGEIQNLAKSCVMGPEEWVLERQGGTRLRISLDCEARSVHFYFS